MADIVLGLGSSHGPTIRTPPEQWDNLAAKDMEDPRYSYAELLAMARPGLEAEVTMEKKRERYAKLQAGVARVQEQLAAAAADVYVVISNPHGVPPLNKMYPVFGMYLSDEGSTIARTGHQSGGRRPDRAPEEGRGVEDFATDPGLTDHLMQSLIDDGFDVAASFQSRTGAGVDGAFTYLYDVYMPDRSVPMVPFLISRYLPNQPTPARAYAFGQALRRAIDGWKSNARVAIMASGGLSHQVLDEELDQEVIRALDSKDAEVLTSLPRDRLNRAPGTAEILNWVALAGAIEDRPMSLIDYVPCYRSEAGTGHGVTFAFWK
jgi:hypothetical protein